MVYVVGIVGLIGGFVLGQMMLYFMLRSRSREELLNDKLLKWKYGLFNWLVAACGAYAFVTMYKQFFG